MLRIDASPHVGSAIAQPRDAEKPTKSQCILALYDGKRTTAEISKIVGCRPEYVRVVARQRKGGKCSEIDRRYQSSPLAKSTRREANARSYNAKCAYYNALDRTCDRAKANAAARKARLAAKRAGKSVKDARNFANAARRRVASRTGDHIAAREAYAQTSTRSPGSSPGQAIGEKAVL